MRLRTPHRGWSLILFLTFASAACAPGQATARDGTGSSALNSPVGLWKTVDDKTGQVKSIVEIREVNGELEGRVVKIFNPPEPHPICRMCTGDLKNKPVMGMRILWGMRHEGDEWTGGRILDPENGEIYRCTMSVGGGGKVLHVRGYIGISIFGRTERWVRANTVI